MGFPKRQPSEPQLIYHIWKVEFPGKLRLEVGQVARNECVVGCSFLAAIVIILLRNEALFHIRRRM